MHKVKLLAHLVLIVSCLSLLCACSSSNNTLSAEHKLEKIELIDETNKSLIGKETLGQVILQDDSQQLPELHSGETESTVEINIPNNNIIHTVENDMVSPGWSIQEIKMNGVKTPELIGPNGVTGIFTKSNGEGFLCLPGNTISWSFEKYPLDNGHKQALAVGYVKDGVMHEANIYQSELSATNQLNITEKGVYYIYFHFSSSDPISLKEGEISILQ